MKTKLGIADWNVNLKFALVGIVEDQLYSFKGINYPVSNSELKVTTKKQILDLYFEYNGKRVLSTDKVPYGAKINVKLVAITQNMIGEQLKFGVTKYTKDSKTAPLEYDGDSILEEFGKATVKSNGIAEIGFVINKGKLDKVASYMASIENYSTKHIKNKMLVLEVGAKWQQPNGQHGIDVNYFLEKYKGVNESNLKILLSDMNEYYTINKITPVKEQVAYILATVYHETLKTFKPVVESFWIADKKIREKTYHRYDPVLANSEERRETAKKYGNTKKGDGVKYSGKGYVQLTWKNNYQKIKDQFGVDVVNYPNKALEPKLAVKILIWGMEKGIFSGAKLSTYINEEKIEYVKARRVINGTDDAVEIAEIAENFEKKIKNGNIAKEAIEKEKKSEAKSNVKYDIDKAVNYINENAEVKSIAKCALYVRKAINAGGIQNLSGHAKEYYDTDKLVKYGFVKISANIDLITLKKGDIVAFGAVKEHEYGHIAMWNGIQWVSDFKQKSFWVASQYSIEKKYAIYRWK